MPEIPRITFRIPTKETITIATAIRQAIPTASWNTVRKWLHGGHVLVNGIPVFEESARVNQTNEIAISPASGGSLARIERSNSEDIVKVVYLDIDVAVVEKPSGVTTQIATDDWEPTEVKRPGDRTLEELMIPIVKKMVLARPEWKSGSPRLVHRLDKDTSGLLVFARTARAYDLLKRQFFEHTIDREYIAIVLGTMTRETTFDSYLIEDRGDGKRGSVNQPERHAKHAITHVFPEQQYHYATQVRCRLETGRTHQIRIHLSEAGHPVLGDPIYGTSFDLIPEIVPAPRLALHAKLLAFDHPNGKRMRFESPLPPDLTKWVKKL
ncbi:MAG: RluA family pseudouridine synthase [bacterium]|nr:RluA family pseudouridine synthase [bacterium]